MKTLRRLLVFVAWVLGVPILFAQTDPSLLGALEEEDKEAIEALVLYPEETRDAILEATLHPELLIRLRALQNETMTKFDAVLNKYSQETQEMLWDLTRYPGLIRQMAALRRTDRQGLNRLLENYPEVIHKRATTAFDNYYDDLLAIEIIQNSSDATFEALLSNYHESTRNAYHALLKLPEVLTILTDNIDLVVLTGDLYRKNPALVRAKADSLHLLVARQQAQDFSDWKESVEKNDAIRDDLLATSQEFAEAHEYEYDDLYCDYEDDIYYKPDQEAKIIIHEYYYYHYPYWFGYPRWYVYPRWRPYPYWWEWGFYVGPSRQIVVIHLPSYYFVNWYFYYPHHHYYYPRVTDHFVRYYNYHPRPVNSITVGVNTWRNNNREVINNAWLENEQNRLERIQEFGKFEWERRRYNEDHQDASLDPYEFYDKNARKYPNIKATSAPETKTPPRARTTTPPADQKKKVEVPRKTETPPPAVEREKAKPTEPPAPRARTERYEDIQKAKELHKQKWEPEKKLPPKTSTEPSKLKKPEVQKTTPRKVEPKKTTEKQSSTPRKKNEL